MIMAQYVAEFDRHFQKVDSIGESGKLVHFRFHFNDLVHQKISEIFF